MPQFVGEGVEMYIVRNIKYPKDALEMKIQGKVYVQFIIEKDGSVSEIKILRPVYPSLDYVSDNTGNASMATWNSER